jgi:hypothetical protein
LYRQDNTAAHSDRSCSILSIDFSFVDVVANGGGFQDGAVGDRLAYPGCLPAYKLGSAAVSLAPFLLPTIQSFQPKAKIACCVVLETHFLHHEMSSFL